MPSGLRRSLFLTGVEAPRFETGGSSVSLEAHTAVLCALGMCLIQPTLSPNAASNLNIKLCLSAERRNAARQGQISIQSDANRRQPQSFLSILFLDPD